MLLLPCTGDYCTSGLLHVYFIGIGIGHGIGIGLVGAGIGLVIDIFIVAADATVANAVNMATATTAFNTFITEPPV
jgi:hypothetical protein